MANAQRKLENYWSKRDFNKTREPRGEVKKRKAPGKKLAFVVHKHAASHLHYDLRLEVHGVMKSWAVPKGPSFDPKVKRLAVEVEDHPLEYKDFEGTIAEDEYGGGTVMIWDEGFYTVADQISTQPPEDLMEQGFERGKVRIIFHGKRLRGAFTLLRTQRQVGRGRSQWLLIKQDDEFADAGYDPVTDEQTSVRSAKPMQAIAHDGEEKKETADLRPMLASTAEELPTGDNLIYEQKFDGVRVLAFIDKEGVALISRQGRDKVRQFPELTAPLRKLSQTLKGPLILDGEIAAIDNKSEPLGFQAMMGRIHLDDEAAVESEISATPVHFFIFDILLHGKKILVQSPWHERRALLEKVMAHSQSPLLRLVSYSDDAHEMKRASEQEGWEGLIVKNRTSTYLPGARTRSWWKWRTLQREEFVIGGFTEPKGSRQLIGSVLLGQIDSHNKLQYVGHAGGGFSQQTLKELYQQLKKREQRQSPFAAPIATHSTPHWVKPELVAEIRFKEWTKDHKLRQGTFLGIRNDKLAQDVKADSERAAAPFIKPAQHKIKKTAPFPSTSPATTELERQLISLPPKEAQLVLDGEVLELSNLDKIFYPEVGITKRDVLLYYASMLDLILPWMQERPLVLKRYPDGVAAKSFYQQEPDESAPGLIERLETEQGYERRLIGGKAITLLYLAQIGALSYDPWHARVGQLEFPDYSIIDLDPGVGTPFATVRQAAQTCLEVLNELGFHAAMKTSGASGIHLYLPLPPETSWETARLAAELLCTLVHHKLQSLTTLERSVKKRPKGTVYLDSQQNYLTRSVAGVWSLRAEPHATVSTPITAKDLDHDIEPGDFTLYSKLRDRQDFWEKPMSHPINLEKLLSLRPRRSLKQD
jgi:bifunctional non-homologous end joining protein LigD